MAKKKSVVKPKQAKASAKKAEKPKAQKPAASVAVKKAPPPKPEPKKAAPAPAKPPAAPVAEKAPRAPRASTGSKVPGPAVLKALPGALKMDEPLSKHTTLRIGGPAKYHFTPGTPEAAAEAVKWAHTEKIPVLVLGLGSNVLIRDKGFPGLVLKMGKGLDNVTVRGTQWTVGAGLPTPLLARRSAEAGLVGIQRLIGVPGTVGGGVYMNAGAHTQDFATVLVSATLMNPATGALEERPRKAINFAYRTSGLEGVIVLGCTVRLEEDSAERAKADFTLYLKKRREGTPFDQSTCGSVFKNPELMTAGKIIERCGLKGRRVGGAEISQLHANYIVNRGGASADDVVKLIDVVRTAVFKEFGVELELEVKVLGQQ